MGPIKILPSTRMNRGIRYKVRLFLNLRCFLKKIKLNKVKARSPEVDIEVSIVIAKIVYLFIDRLLLIKLKITAKFINTWKAPGSHQMPLVRRIVYLIKPSSTPKNIKFLSVRPWTSPIKCNEVKFGKGEFRSYWITNNAGQDKMHNTSMILIKASENRSNETRCTIMIPINSKFTSTSTDL